MTDVFPCEITGKTGKAAEVQLFWEGLWEGRAAGRWADVTSWWWGAIWFTCQDVNSFASFMSVFLCHSYWIEVCHLTLFLAEWHQHPLVGFACRAGLWAKWTDRKSGTEPGPRWASQSSRRGWSSSSVCAKFTLPHGLPSLAPAYSCSYHQLEHVGVWTCSHLSCPQHRNESVAVWKSHAQLAWEYPWASQYVEQQWRMVSACSALDQFSGMSAMSILFMLLLLTKSVTSAWFRAVIWPKLAYACEHSHPGCYRSLVKPSGCYLTMNCLASTLWWHHSSLLCGTVASGFQGPAGSSITLAMTCKHRIWGCASSPGIRWLAVLQVFWIQKVHPNYMIAI